MANTAQKTDKEHASPQRPRVLFPLWLKVLTLTTALAVLPALVLGLVLLKFKTASQELSVRQLMLAVTSELAQSVEVPLESAQQNLEAVSQTLSRPLPDGLPQEVRLEMAQIQVATSIGLDHAIVYTADGGFLDVIKEQGTTPPEPPKMLPPKMLEAVRSKNVAFSDPFVEGQAVRLWVAVPVRPPNKDITGVVVSAISLATLQTHLEELQDTHYPEDRDAVYVVDANSRLVAHPDPAEALALKKRKDSATLADVAQLSSSRALSSGEFISTDGRPMVGAIKPLTTVPWSVVVQQPQAEVYREIQDTQRLTLWVVLAAIFVSVVTALAFVQTLARPIARLMAFAQALAGRRFEERVEINTRDELAVLGSVLSNAAADLEASEDQLRQEAAIRSDLGRYLPREVVERVVRREQEMTLGGQRRQITVLFADVVGFTPMTEELGAEEIVGLLNELFTIMTEIVFRHQGTVDKFIGDCLMAFWNAPTEQPDHAELAVAAAEDMMRFLEVGNAGWEERHGLRVQLAIGIHTGEAVVGNVGSESRMAYTAIGEVVNVAARLEAIARPQQILITEATATATDDLFETMPFGTRKLTARSEDVLVFEVVV